MVVKRIFIILMVLLLIFTPARNCYAAAETAALTVVGGSVAAGGIGAALVAVAPVAIVVAGIALAAQGIYVALDDASSAAGMTKTEFIEAKFKEFCEETGRSFDRDCRMIASGAKILADGTIAIANDVSDLFKLWINNLVSSETIYNPTVSGNVVNAFGVNMPVVLMGQMYDCGQFGSYASYSVENYSGNGNIALCYSNQLNGTEVAIYAIADKSNLYVKLYTNGHNSTPAKKIKNYEKNGLWMERVSGYTANYNLNLPFVQDLERKFISDGMSFDIVVGSPEFTRFEGEVANINTNEFDNADGKVTILNPGLPINDIAQNFGKSGTISIDNYLQTLARALNGVQDNTITISESLTGALENVAVGTYNPVGEASISEEDEETIVAGVYTPAIDTSINPEGHAAERSLRGLTFDLTEIFPFCIPFDLFALIEKFDVTPVTPNVHLVIPLGGISEDLVLDLDFTPFETVAQVLRTMELIAFVVGLAMVTRHIIRG